MGIRVYRVRVADRGQLDRALLDDVLGRQSLTLRDARRMGERTEGYYLFVEGTDAGLLRADALILEFGERVEEPEALLARLRGEEEDAASGLGSVFDGF